MRKAILAATAAVSAGLLAGQANAADRVWDGSDSNVWALAANWETGTTNANNGAIFYTGTPANLSPYTDTNAITAYMVFNDNADSDVVLRAGNNTATARSIRLQSGVATTAAGSGSLPVGNGAIIITAGSAGTHSITQYGSGGRVILGVATDSSASYIFKNDSGQVFTISAPIYGDLLNNSAGTRTMNFTGSWNITGNITRFTSGDSISTFNATVAVSKAGTGTLKLAGTNDYVGTSTISGGTLLVNGSTSGADNFSFGTLAASATLGGTGTIGLASGKSVIAAGTSAAARAIVAPGDGGIESLDITGAVSLGANSTLAVELNAVTGDLLNVTGNVTIDASSSRLDITELATATAETYTVLNYSGSLANSFAEVYWGGTQRSVDSSTGQISGTNYKLFYNAADTSVQLVLIPEPAAVSMLGGLASLALLRRRRQS